MDSPELHLSLSVDRIIRIWALIKMVPEQQLSSVRSLVETVLREHAHMTENELFVLGLKHLHSNADSNRLPLAVDTGKARAAAR
jgi:hypothetical protein